MHEIDRIKTAKDVLIQVERMLFKRDYMVVANFDEELDVIRKLLTDIGHVSTVKAVDITWRTYGDVDFDDLLQEIDSVLYEYFDPDGEMEADPMLDSIIDALSVGDLNSLTNGRGGGLRLLLEALHGASRRSPELTDFYRHMSWLAGYHNALLEGPLVLTDLVPIAVDGDDSFYEDEDDDEDTEMDYRDDRPDSPEFGLGDPLFPDEED